MSRSTPAPTGKPAAQSKPQHSNRQTLWIVGAIAAAVIVALVLPRLLDDAVFGRFVAAVFVGGEIFLRLLKMIVVPLVMASVMSGIIGLGDVRKLGRPGLYTILYYFSTTVLAVVLGLVVVNVVRPGVGFDSGVIEKARTQGEKELHEKFRTAEDGQAEKGQQNETPRQPDSTTPDADAKYQTNLEQPGVGFIFRSLLLRLFTDNLLKSMVETDLLPLIVFSMAFAAVLTTIGKRAEPIARLIESANDALLSFVLLLMKLAPLGIFCLVAARFGKAELEGSFFAEIKQTAYYVLSVLIGLGIHAFVTLPLILLLFARRHPYRFMLQVSEAILTAFSTASSSATLPVTLESAQTKAGISKRSAEFVLPLGATINMDGTALYEACAAIFIAQAVGLELSLLGQLTIALTATVAAIGAAGIPHAGLVTMVIVLKAVGLPVELIGLVIPVDWFVDRFRTAVNVFGDAVGAAAVEKSFAD